jgi:hypothetical protein
MRNRHANFGVTMYLPYPWEGLKGQRVKKFISANIDAGNIKFGQNV